MTVWGNPGGIRKPCRASNAISVVASQLPHDVDFDIRCTRISHFRTTQAETATYGATKVDEELDQSSRIGSCRAKPNRQHAAPSTAPRMRRCARSHHSGQGGMAESHRFGERPRSRKDCGGGVSLR